MVVPWYNYGEPWLDYGMTTMVEPWYHGRFCHGTPILLNLDNSLRVEKWHSKSGSKIKNHLFTDTPYYVMVQSIFPSVNFYYRLLPFLQFLLNLLSTVLGPRW